MSYFYNYLSCLMYTLCLTLCVYPYFHHKSSFKRILGIVSLYSVISFIIMSDGVFQLEKYIIAYIMVVICDWLMMSWLNHKVDIWIMFYTTFYLSLYVVSVDTILYLTRSGVQGAHLFQAILINGVVLGVYYLFKSIHLLPERALLEAHTYVFNIINMIALIVFVLFFGFQMIAIQGGYMILIYIIFMVLWLYLIYILKRSFLIQQEKEELALVAMCNRNVEQYIAHYQQENENMSKIRHDLKNHLLILKNLKEVDKIQDYIQFIVDDIQESFQEKCIESGNIYIDTCLNIKIKEYPDVHFVYDIDVQDLNMNGKDLCSLLFNLIDNAAKAANACQGEVELQLIYDEGHFIISIYNDYLHQPDFISHESEHGYGMKIIQGFVKAYNGSMEINDYEGRVYIDICIEL